MTTRPWIPQNLPPPKYYLNHLPPDPGKQIALKNNLSNKNKASYLEHPLQTQSRHQLTTQYTIFSSAMPISVLSLAPCDLFKL